MTNLKDLAEDAIANAADAGWQYTECPHCGEGGWWGRQERVEACPLCGGLLEFLVVPVYNANGALLAYEYHAVGSTPEELDASRQKAEREAQLTATMYGSAVATTGYGWRVSTTPLPPCTCGEGRP